MKTLIAIPCMDMVHTDFLRALLSLEVSGDIQFTTAQGSLIYDARNHLAEIAIDGNFDRVLWLDSDIIFEPSTFRRLSEHLDLGKEIVSGLYFTRKNPIKPVIYKDLWQELLPDGKRAAHAESFDDYPRDDLFQAAGCGFGCVMTSVDLLRRVRDQLGMPFAPEAGFGEDLAFCLRARQLGAEIWIDSTIKCGHVGMAVFDEDTYRAVSGSNTAPA